MLLAEALSDPYAPRLCGPNFERRSDGTIALTGEDPRISWELDYAEAHWITHSIAGQLLVNLEKLQHPSISDDEARTRVLDSLATRIADAIRPQLADLGDNGIQSLLPPPGRGTARARRQHGQGAGRRRAPLREQLPPSNLDENLYEKTGLATTGWGILRQVRDTVMNSFDLDESDFGPDVPCLLRRPTTVSIGGEDRSLDALDADILPLHRRRPVGDRRDSQR